MAKFEKIAYQPDYAVPPGETLRETMQALGMSQIQLAARTGLSAKTINGIVNGKEVLTPKTAILLQRVLGIKATFWNNMEADYRAALAAEAEQESLKRWIGWAKRMPYKILQQRGVLGVDLHGQNLVSGLLDFFGVSSPETWDAIWTSPQAAFRSSPAFRSAPEAVAVWLRLGELASQVITTGTYSESKLKGAAKEARRLTTATPDVFCHKLGEICADAGVALVFIPELPKLRLCGASRWLTPDKALIQLSLRYKRNDQLWFTLFHEIGHLLLHGKKEVFIDSDTCGQERKEREAHAFAAETLIPTKKLSAFLSKLQGKRPTKPQVIAFAEELGIHPGIVVGRLQHDKIIEYNQMTDLFQRVKWNSLN
ncbi:MAG: HigA family addiction module antidote protein [Desulfarculus sp.]|nr:HigA family addiction module antidote protein [Desulfarculus sp.]